MKELNDLAGMSPEEWEHIVVHGDGSTPNPKGIMHVERPKPAWMRYPAANRHERRRGRKLARLDANRR